MKKKNLLIIASLFITVVTLSSWRLFGKETVSGGFSDTPDQSQCIQHGFQDRYFFGIRISNDVPVTRVVDCNNGSALTAWQ